MLTRQSIVRRFWSDEDGPSATEYAMLLAIIAGGTLVAMAAFGDKVYAIYVALSKALVFT